MEPINIQYLDKIIDADSNAIVIAFEHSLNLNTFCGVLQGLLIQSTFCADHFGPMFCHFGSGRVDHF
jgi:hypothetical protein